MCRLPFLVISAILAGTPLEVQAQAGTSPSGSDRRITLMSYNAENLFDTADNPANPGDNTYLPLSQKGTPEHKALCERQGGTAFQKRECLQLDWSEEVLTAKLHNLAALIDAFDGGRGPDVLVLQEVENQAVLDRLRDALAGGAAYRTAINTESSPGRGINVALLSKLALAVQCAQER